ncbi:MAG: DNA polymerase III subunit delta [Gemmatimonadota bacterium]|nr:DNA polymerase III subunit delta [Gemmatimonadota bacterium]
MPKISAERLLAALGTPTGGVFFLSGDEPFLREEMLARIVDAHLDPATRDFNFDSVRGGEVSAEQLASLLATPPMMAEWRIVVVRDAQGLSARAREAVEQAAGEPVPGLALIVSASIPSGSKARFYTLLEKHATSVDFAPLDPMEAPGWLVERARAFHGRALPIDAARALTAAAGTDLGTLVAELAKVVEYAGERAELSLDDARAVGVHIARVDRWAWFDAVAERRFADALADLPVLLDSGENGVGLVIGLGAQLLRVGLVCAGGSAALEAELKPFQRWMAHRVAAHARRWTLPQVEAALAELLRTDRLLKSASLSDAQALSELLLRLRSPDAAGLRAA